jgi:diguanylate cyclase (GGDEF)-like protein/PAS domain S-box-containing protein
MLQHHVLQPSFDLYEMRASVLIAATASYAALTLAGRVRAREGRLHLAWIGWGGTALGLGIAAMHFVGMLSMQLPVDVRYETGRTLLSVLFAIAASTLALDIGGDKTLGAARLAIGSLLFGGAVAGMHFIGISAIRAPVVIDHQPVRVVVSIVIAVSTGAGALYLAFRLRDGTGASAGAQRIAGAVILGLAIVGMHYTAMSAMKFHALPNYTGYTTFDGPTFSGRNAYMLVATASFLVLVGAIVSAFVDQNVRHEFSETQRTLEHRVLVQEAETAKATELYRLLAEHATDMVSTHTADGRFEFVSPTWAEFLDAEPTTIIGKRPIDYAHPHDVPVLVANHKRGLKSADVLTTLWRCRKGNDYAWVETTTRAVRDQTTSRVKTLVCATRDVSHRKQIEEQLSRSEARFRAAAEGSFDGFFVLEAVRNVVGQITDFRYSELNTRGETLISRSRSQVIGRTMSEVFPKTAQSNIEKLARVVESGTPYQEEIEYRSRTRPTRWLHHQIVPLGDGVAVTSRDVTDRKHSEEELRALTLVDDLTGLYNRRGFRMLAEQHMRLVKRGGPVSLLVCFDLDGFKRVNDVYGHAEGDAALRRAASILRTAFRDSDIIARFGGDEFVVLALDCGEIRETLLGRVDAAVDAHNEAAACPYSLSLSLGTAQLDPFAPTSLDELMVEADANLYQAKRGRTTREMMA